jgi:hypothetical protein
MEIPSYIAWWITLRPKLTRSPRYNCDQQKACKTRSGKPWCSSSNSDGQNSPWATLIQIDSISPEDSRERDLRHLRKFKQYVPCRARDFKEWSSSKLPASSVLLHHSIAYSSENFQCRKHWSENG